MEYKNAFDFLLYSYFGFDGGLQKSIHLLLLLSESLLLGLK